MIKYNLSCSGCLAIFIIGLILIFILKQWFFILLFILISSFLSRYKYYIDKFTGLFTQKEFRNKPGEVYKYCKYCDTKADRNALVCPNCNKLFE